MKRWCWANWHVCELDRERGNRCAFDQILFEERPGSLEKSTSGKALRMVTSGRLGGYHVRGECTITWVMLGGASWAAQGTVSEAKKDVGILLIWSFAPVYVQNAVNLSLSRQPHLFSLSSENAVIIIWNLPLDQNTMHVRNPHEAYLQCTLVRG